MNFFIGIDQTGAALSKGLRAKPLPICIAEKQKSGSWRFRTEAEDGPLKLEKFQPEYIKAQLERLRVPYQWGNKIGFVVDCVLGIPEVYQKKNSSPAKVKPYLWGLFERAVGFSKGGKEFGRDVAEAFFSELALDKSEPHPKRFCEEVSGSNSVFQSRPYQKNIQTGTFRLWKDMGSNGKPWANLWPFEQEKVESNLPWLFEGYPSLLWKECLGSPVRDLKKLRRLAEKALPNFEMDTWKYLEKSPDLADSFALAFGGVYLQEKKRLWIPSPSFVHDKGVQTEGWLLGLRHPKDI